MKASARHFVCDTADPAATPANSRRTSQTAPPDAFVVPVFPRKYAVWDATREVLTFGGVDYEMGDAIAAGDGWGPPSEDTEIPSTCKPDESGDVMHVQDTSLATMSERGY